MDFEIFIEITVIIGAIVIFGLGFIALIGYVTHQSDDPMNDL